MIWAEKQFVVW